VPNHVEGRFRFEKWLWIVKDSASETVPIFGFGQLFWATLDEPPGEWDPMSDIIKVRLEYMQLT
jgi:hypothetical protein